MSWARHGPGEVRYVLIHGLACRGSQWDPVVALLARDAGVVVVDLPGHGDAAGQPGPYTIDAFAAAVASVIDEACEGPVVLVGHSMGGAVAVTAAALRPDRVTAVVALDSLLNRHLHTRQNRVVAGIYRAVFQRWWYRPAMKRVVDGLFLPTADPAIKARVLQDMAATAPRVTAQAAHSLARWDRDRALAEVTAPVTIYDATERGRTPATAGLGRHCEVRSFPDGGHFFFIEHPEQTAAAIVASPVSTKDPA